MQREAVYDLASAKPHVADGLRLEPREFQLYCQGYYMALAMALKVIDHAAQRFALYQRTKRLEAKRKREGA